MQTKFTETFNEPRVRGLHVRYFITSLVISFTMASVVFIGGLILAKEIFDRL